MAARSPRRRRTIPDSHGTHTAATICGVAVKGQNVGVAPGAKLMSGLVIEGGNTTARILGGLDWLVGNNVRVISMSLGYPGYDPVFLELVKRLISRNALPVFAIGNEGPNTSRSPGNYVGTFSIGAMDEEDHTAAFSGSQHFTRSRDAEKAGCGGAWRRRHLREAGRRVPEHGRDLHGHAARRGGRRAPARGEDRRRQPGN